MGSIFYYLYFPYINMIFSILYSKLTVKYFLYRFRICENCNISLWRGSLEIFQRLVSFLFPRAGKYNIALSYRSFFYLTWEYVLYFSCSTNRPITIMGIFALFCCFFFGFKYERIYLLGCSCLDSGWDT